MLHSIRTGLGLVVLLALLGPSPGAAEPDGGAAAWWPTDVGSRWTYVYARERVRRVGGAQPEVVTLRGTRLDEVVRPAPELGGGAVEVQSVWRGRTGEEPGAREETESRRQFVSSAGPSVRVFAREAPHPLSGERELVRFAPPLERLRPGAVPSEPWTAGVEEAGGLRTEYRGEVLGVQDAQTPSGLYEKCLVVRITGTTTGGAELYGQEYRIDRAQVTWTEWYAPGVGLVLSKGELEQTLRLGDGSRMEISEKTQFALSDVVLAGAPGTSPLPAAPGEPAASGPQAAPRAVEPPPAAPADPAAASDPPGAAAPSDDAAGIPSP